MLLERVEDSPFSISNGDTLTITHRGTGVFNFFGGPPVDLSTPSPKALAWLLRHREKWPRGFKFDFIDCNKCAMGLMHRFWFSDEDEIPSVEWSAKALGISVHQAIDIFVARHMRGNTPEDIALDLDRL